MIQRRRGMSTVQMPISIRPLIHTLLIVCIIITAVAISLRFSHNTTSGWNRKFRVVQVRIPESHTIHIDGVAVKLNHLKKYLQKALVRSPIKTVLVEIDPSVPSRVRHAVTDAVWSIEGAYLVTKKWKAQESD